MGDLTPTLHHLSNSQSHRILWLLEELEIPYNLKLHDRINNGVAPPELSETHPLGKAPQLETGDGRVIIESIAIAKYLIDIYDKDKRLQGDGRPENDVYRDEELCSFAGTSIGPYIVMKVIFDYLSKHTPFIVRPVFSGIHGMLQKAFLGPELAKQFKYLNDQLGDRDYFMGSKLGRADIIISWPVDNCTAKKYIDIKQYPKLDAWYKRCHERPAWKRSLEKGNKYDLATI